MKLQGKAHSAQIRRIFTLIIGFSLVCSLFAQKVVIFNDATRYKLILNGKPFFIKGAVASEYIEKIALYGGNSIRSGWRKQQLDKASELGLMVLVNLPARAERSGMDYSDTAQIQSQKRKIMDIVKQVKDHPAVLMWAIGNELDYIPPLKPYNVKVWDAVNDIASEIHRIDPNHPVMTVIGISLMEKVAEIARRCPSLDLLGINAYGAIYEVPATLRRYGWDKPYVITEWGPDGYWEMPRTPWEAPFEQTGREKAISYEKKYKEVVLADSAKCLGSYVFYWSGHKQETTHTWFCMFDKDGNESATVDLMRALWTGKAPSNSAPVLDSIFIEGFRPLDGIFLQPGTTQNARAFAEDKDHDTLIYNWEIRPEAHYASYAGQGEQEPQPLNSSMKIRGQTCGFIAPEPAGPYRLYVYVYDGHGHFSTANLPFYVKARAAQ